MESQQLVTVIIPTFNREKRISNAIDSALLQTYKNIQVIVIDDGSTDKTADLLKSYTGIEYYYKENGGQASARNLGLKHAKGDIIASLDSDDVWYPDFLEKCVTKLTSDGMDFVFANWDQDTRNGASWDFLSKDPFLTPFMPKEKDNWIDLSEKEVRDLYLRSCPSPSSSLVIRRSTIVSGWDEEMNIGDDWCMYLEAVLNKKCKASFTLQKLWNKRVDKINLYDGRKWSEILEFLYIADLKKKIIKFKHLLSPREIKVLEERYMASLVEFAKHNLIRELNIKYSLILLIRSLSINVPFTLRAIPKVFMKGLQGKLKMSDN